MMQRFLSTIAAGALLLVVAAVPSQGQDAGDAQLRGLLDELNAQLERGERERLIDPWFLRDLRDLVRRYDWPWQNRLFSDDFSGRGSGPDAPWQVTAGEFLIDWRYGLRSVITAQPPAGASGSRSATGEEAVAQIFGQILQQSLGGGTRETGGAAQASFAAAKLLLALPDAFALTVELSERAPQAGGARRLEFGPYRGANAAHGYRLVYSGGAAGAGPGLELLRLTDYGTNTLFRSDAVPDLADGQVHKVLWTRDAGGQMQIRLDGETVMQVVDRSWNDGFQGIAVVNAGGDFALRQIAVDGP